MGSAAPRRVGVCALTGEHCRCGPKARPSPSVYESASNRSNKPPTLRRSFPLPSPALSLSSASPPPQPRVFLRIWAIHFLHSLYNLPLLKPPSFRARAPNFESDPKTARTVKNVFSIPIYRHRGCGCHAIFSSGFRHEPERQRALCLAFVFHPV